MKELRAKAQMTQREMAEFLNVPIRTLQDWESGRRVPPAYVEELIEYKLKNENKLKERA